MRPLAQHNGNDEVQTPIHLAKIIVKHFHPSGTILEPCCGDGNFLKLLPNADWCEINLGVDFLALNNRQHWDWIITNPPYSKYRAFLRKAMEVADNVVFLQLINATFYKARLTDMDRAGFGIAEILFLDTPKDFPQFGFQLGCVHYKRGHIGCTIICRG